MARWCIVGGGILGMELSRRITRAGHHVTVYEGAPVLGGLASAWSLGDFAWDRHYHVTLYSDLSLRALIDELGMTDDLTWVTAQTGFYARGQMYPFSSIADYVRFPVLTPLEKARLGATILYASRLTNWRALERVTAVTWLRRLSGRGVVEKVWLPLLRAKLGSNAERASAAFIWAIIARMYAARRAGLKQEYFGYVRGGYARVLERFSERLRTEGVTLESGRPASRVLREPDGSMRVEFPNAPAERFDRVVVTAAAPVAAKLCPQLTEHERELLDGVLYQGIVCASVLTERSLTPYYITNITDASLPFTAVIEMTALVDRATFGGKSLIYLPRYLPSEDPLMNEPDDVVQENFLAALGRMHPGFDRRDINAFRISRVRYVLPLSTPGYSDRLPPMVTSVPGLAVVNSVHILNGTLNVNETLQLAERAAGNLLSAPARPPLRETVSV
ncbi:MAG: NAD(P)/FAD-dependent oxidoreductase [Vulcanimicrobiaceae bacterium]